MVLPFILYPMVVNNLFLEYIFFEPVFNKIKAPEREKNHLYSLPLSFFQTQRFYQLASLPPIEKEFLDEKGRILSISHVLETFPDSFIVLPEEYSFGERIDDDLKQVNREQILRIANNIY